MLTEAKSRRRVVLLAVDTSTRVAKLVARLELHATYLAEKAVDVVDRVEGAHDLLIAVDGLRTRLADAAHASTAVHLEVIVTAQNHLIPREALLA